LAVESHKLSVLGQKLSVAVRINQSVKPFLFLILKRSIETPPPSAPKTLATAAEEFVVENQLFSDASKLTINVHDYPFCFWQPKRRFQLACFGKYSIADV